MADLVRGERRGAAQWIVIDREERKNALNEAVLSGMIAAIQAAEANPAVRAIVITGAGDKVFCAGGDLKPSADGNPFEVDPAEPRNPVIDLFKVMEQSRLPIVARVNGHALGGGFGLVCACDMAVASETARLGTPEARIGLFPMMILPYMQRVVPRRRLLEMCITAEPWTAREAFELGIVNYIAPPAELDARLDWLLQRIIASSPTAIRLGKTAFHATQDMGLAQAFEYTQAVLPHMARTEDAREGFRAFNERRAPKWTGR